MSVMLYKSPGPHCIHGVQCEYVVVKAEEVDEYISNGWCENPADLGGSDAKGSGLSKQEEASKEEATKEEKGEVVEVVKKKRGRPPKNATLGED
jgi:hypothetical protein